MFNTAKQPQEQTQFIALFQVSQYHPQIHPPSVISVWLIFTPVILHREMHGRDGSKSCHL